MSKIDYLDYKLKELDVLPLLFQVADGAKLPLSGVPGEIARYLSEHPRSSLKELNAIIPSLEMLEYKQGRAQLVRMVDAGVLEVCGELPMEEVDDRYERVAACDLCGKVSNTHPIVFWKHNTPVVRCSSCDLLYANPRWKAEFLFGRYTPDYWDHYEEERATQQVNPADAEDHIARYLWTLEPVFSTGRLLDVGCATGEFLKSAKDKGWQVYGVETSPISAKIAQESTGGEVHVGLLETAPWQDNFFDAITMFDVIEHLQSPHAYVEKSASLLRPGGFLALNTPNIHSAAFRLLGKQWDVIGPNDHLYYFEPRTLQKLLVECGFEIHMIISEPTGWQVWAQFLRFRSLLPLAGKLAGWTSPVITRRLLGDSFYMVARLKDK